MFVYVLADTKNWYGSLFDALKEWIEGGSCRSPAVSDVRATGIA